MEEANYSLGFISILFLLWCSDVVILAKNDTVVDGPDNSTVAKNESAGVGSTNFSMFTKEYCTNEAKEMIINPQEITRGHITNAQDEHVHIYWQMTVKPPELAICLRKVSLWFGGNPNATFSDKGWIEDKKFPFDDKVIGVFKVRREHICGSKNKIFIEYWSFRTHYHPTAITLDKKHVKLSSCPTEFHRQKPLSDFTIWTLVFGALFFFIVCLLCLLRPRKEEPGSSLEVESDSVYTEEELDY